jgi:hypothetical protein
VKKRILLFNFFAGILRRGIPLYVDNLAVALERSGARCYELRCPQFLSGLPRSVLNAMYVAVEQLVMPLAGLAFDRTIYPYNSVAVLAGFSRRASVVIHDHIPNHARDRKLAARYIRATQLLFADFGGDVIYSSSTTMRIGQRIHQFPVSRQFLFPNAFYRLIALRSDPPPAREDFILLCTGWGKHKDLPGALELYLQSGLFRLRPLRILGLAGHTDDVDLFCSQHPDVADRITVYPRLPDSSVVRAYETASWIWIHSLREGYGRSLAEARLCGGRIVATSILPFREQADEYVFLYSDLAGFQSAVARCEAAPEDAPRRSHFEHAQLMAEIERFILPSHPRLL